MGDPRKLRKKYESPKKVWDKERLLVENKLISQYGLKNMRELWKMSLIVKRVRREVRKLFALADVVAEERGRKIIERLYNLGIVGKDSRVEDLLSLTVEDILKRRLQTVVFINGLAKNIKMARQLIVHGFIAVNGKKATRPSMLVGRDAQVTAIKELPGDARSKSVGSVSGAQRDENQPGRRSRKKEVRSNEENKESENQKHMSKQELSAEIQPEPA